MARSLILVLGDQLSLQMTSLCNANRAQDVVMMAEVQAEATYAWHHKKKLAFIFSAMRHFAAELQADGWEVDYVRLDAPGNTQSLGAEVQRALKRHQAEGVILTEPAEWRLLSQMREWPNTRLLPDKRFIADRNGFAEWAEGRTDVRMEYFYRLMRRKTGLLMEGDKPAGGRWNFDAENRARAAPDLMMPHPLKVSPDEVTREVLALVEAKFTDHFGDLEPFWFATTRANAKAAFEHFLTTALPDFGAYQDAMLTGEHFLYHSVVSLYLNVGLLDPLEMCQAVEAQWRAGRVPLNSAEGFIRQIIGWREFVRGIYWWKMPDYAQSNALNATNSLPSFYWTGETPMQCVRECVRQTRQEAYAHHIQRLMVTGNFALLAGVNPQQVHEWYLAVYADAFEWVEMPNTIGMSLFADGGLFASKPYAASGAYINRMSDYCQKCSFDVKTKEGPKACPFNLLYWRFIAKHRERFLRNPRMAQMVRMWDKFDPRQQEQLIFDAEHFLAGLF